MIRKHILITLMTALLTSTLALSPVQQLYGQKQTKTADGMLKLMNNYVSITVPEEWEVSVNDVDLMLVELKDGENVCAIDVRAAEMASDFDMDEMLQVISKDFMQNPSFSDVQVTSSDVGTLNGYTMGHISYTAKYQGGYYIIEQIIIKDPQKMVHAFITTSKNMDYSGADEEKKAIVNSFDFI